MARNLGDRNYIDFLVNQTQKEEEWRSLDIRMKLYIYDLISTSTAPDNHKNLGLGFARQPAVAH